MLRGGGWTLSSFTVIAPPSLFSCGMGTPRLLACAGRGPAVPGCVDIAPVLLRHLGCMLVRAGRLLEGPGSPLVCLDGLNLGVTSRTSGRGSACG
jgi:hypothetical protein